MDRDGLDAEVFDGLFGASALDEDSAAAVWAGCRPAVRNGLDLGGDEPYSFHGRALLLLFGTVFVVPNNSGISRPFLRPPFMKRLS